MAWIKNVSLDDVKKGNIPHDTGHIISIVDPGMFNPDHRPEFPQTDFWFLDIEDDCETSIQAEDAGRIAKILKDCLANNINVIVHCVVGVCRSGAVAECGVILGFEDTGAYRSPNILVKKMILNALGLRHSWEDVPEEAPEGVLLIAKTLPDGGLSISEHKLKE